MGSEVLDDVVKSKIEIILKKLQSKQKLERDKGFLELNLVLKKQWREINFDSNPSLISLICDYCEENSLRILNDAFDNIPWETVLGTVSCIKCLAVNGCLKNETVQCVLTTAEKCLQHDEVRVRLAFGDLLQELSKLEGIGIYNSCKELVLNLIQTNLERQIEVPEENDDPDSLRRASTSSVDIFHETAGWRYLESSMKCLQCIIQGCGSAFNSSVNQQLLDLIFTALTHTNRFVRETGFYVCGTLVNIGHDNMDANSILTYGDQFSKQIALGLADNWSQVRLASSVCARNFLLSFSDGVEREKYYSVLLPKMCLNRYYVAEGVRIYSQETWRQITNGKGRDLVAKHISEFVEYYSASTKADNHAVREAACACIAELGDKIDKTGLKTHVSELLHALLESFHDDSWPVRDAACVACGKFVLNFADESRGVKQELYNLFLLNLKDPISSVRQGAALAVCNFGKAYGQEAMNEIVNEMKAAFVDTKSQLNDVGKYIEMDSQPGQFGVIKRNRDNDMDLHTNQQMYSCGSLAPKMGRGNKESAPSGGCSSCTFKRESQPWERADGCLYLFALLVKDFSNNNDVVELIPLIIEASKYENYTQHAVFLETLCKQLPSIASGFGKKEFKKHLELFIDPIFTAYASDTQLTSHAAEECIRNLSQFIGQNILRGRIENYDLKYLPIYENIIHAQSVQSNTLRSIY